MTRRHLITIALSTLAIAAAGWHAVRAAAELVPDAVNDTHLVLQAAAARAQTGVDDRRRTLPLAAQKLGGNEALGAELNKLMAVLNNMAAAPRPAAWVRSRIDELKAGIREFIGDLREAEPDVDGVAIVSEGGLVLVGDGGVLRAGDRLWDAGLEEGAAAADDNGNDADNEQRALRGLGLAALREGLSTGVLVRDGAIYHAAAAAIVWRKKVLGTVFVERPVTRLADVPGAQGFLVVDGAVTLGQAPDGFALPVLDIPEAQLLVPAATKARVLGLELSFEPKFVQPNVAGTWGQRFEVPGTAAAFGLVYRDLAPVLARVASLQLQIMLGALLVWLMHVVLVLGFGRAVGRGIMRIADHMSKQEQGVENGAAVLSEREFPPELRRLIRLLNKWAETRAKVARGAIVQRSPTVEEVLQAQAVTPPPEVSELEFEGITNSGSMGLAAKSHPGQDTAEQPNPLAAVGNPFEGDDALELEAAPSIAALEDTESDEGLAEGQTNDPVPPPPPDGAIEHPTPLSAEQLDEGAADAPESSGLSELSSLGVLKPPGEVEPSTLETAIAEPEAADEEPAQPDAPVPERVMAMSPELMAELDALVGDEQTRATNGAASTPHAGVVDGADATQDRGSAPLEPSSQAAEPEPEGEPTNADLRPYYDVFEKFMATRRECGDAAALSYEKFSARLEQSKAAVMAKHGCADVEFQVYIKNGKAALKASPAR